MSKSDDTETPEQLRERVAVHEAGHAALALLFDRPFASVTIQPDGEHLGCIHRDDNQLRAEPWHHHRVYETIMELLGGQLAELRMAGDYSFVLGYSEGDPHDDMAHVRARLAPFGRLTDKVLEVLVIAAANLVERPSVMRAVAVIRDALLDRTTLTEADAKALTGDSFTDDDRRLVATWLTIIDDEVDELFVQRDALFKKIREDLDKLA